MSLPPLFFQESASDLISLVDDDARHCFKVLRLKPGNPVHVTNGNGKLFLYHIQEANPKNVVISYVETIEEAQPPAFIRLAVSPLKNPDRFEWLVEKTVEIGVSVITPVICERTESNRLNIPRLQRIINSAMKQSRQYWRTVLDDAVPFRQIIDESADTFGFIAWCEDKPAGHLVNLCRNKLPATVLIGPEGDFSQEEVRCAVDNGFEVVSLGNARLRSETAAIAALHSLHLGNL